MKFHHGFIDKRFGDFFLIAEAALMRQAVGLVLSGGDASGIVMNQVFGFRIEDFY